MLHGHLVDCFSVACAVRQHEAGRTHAGPPSEPVMFDQVWGSTCSHVQSAEGKLLKQVTPPALDSASL